MPRQHPSALIESYQLRSGSDRDQELLLKFMQQTYQELQPEEDFSHLAHTVEQYLSRQTPLWFVEPTSTSPREEHNSAVACLWLGNAVDQVHGDRHMHIFLVYVAPNHRRRGIGSALMRHAETWAQERGDRQISLQVLQSNPSAINFYQSLGYQTQAFWLVKPLASP